MDAGVPLPPNRRARRIEHLNLLINGSIRCRTRGGSGLNTGVSEHAESVGEPKSCIGRCGR